MSISKRYLARAEEMLVLAKKAPTAEARAEFEKMAQGWRALAEHRKRSDIEFPNDEEN